MPSKYEVLAGLPPYGPPVEPFSATGHGTHREGFVVRFHASGDESWVGNFQPGLGKLCGVYAHPNEREFIVVSNGQGYIVEPNDPAKRCYLNAHIEAVISVAAHSLLVLSNGIELRAIGSDGLVWETPRLSWDGLYDVEVDEFAIRGMAWSPLDDDLVPFSVDLLTGEASGGSYR